MNPTIVSLFVLSVWMSEVSLDAQSTNPPTRLPEVVVSGRVPSGENLSEERAIGPYDKPEWTEKRRFPTTRVYLQRDPWEVGFEQWWRGRFYRNGAAKHLLQEEVEVGLPFRSQLDLYENWTIDDHRRMRHDDVAGELRWAPADWGKIPLNPTLYGEWKSVDKEVGPDVYEVKLLLGEELAPRWHWGLNLAREQEVGGKRATEYAWSQAVSYTVIDEKLSAGIEMEFSHETEEGSRSKPEISFVIGPSLQWRPTRWSHLDIVPLFGATGDSPRVEAFVVFGIDLWGGKGGRRFGPASLRSQ